MLVLFLSPSICHSEEPENPIRLLINLPTKYNKPSKRTSSEIGMGLLGVIRNAEKSIDFAIYGLRGQPEIVEALISAQDRGVRIRGVVDKDINNENYYSDTQMLFDHFPEMVKSDYFKDLKTANAIENKTAYKPFWPKPKGFDGPPQCIGYSLTNNKAIIAVHASREPLEFKGDIMHNKFVISDNKILWTGSCNLSDSGTGGYNANIAVVVHSTEVTNWYTDEFNQMFEGSLYHRDKTNNSKTQRLQALLSQHTEVYGYFSPQGYAMLRGLRPILQNAKEEINIAVFFLTHKLITADLIKAHNRGVRVKIILDATAAKNGYTKHEILRAAGIPLKIENWGGKMHMKAASIDKKILVLGSMNWTSAGEQSNDENTLIFKDKELAHSYNKAFELMWNSIPDKWLTRRPDPESYDSPLSTQDGIDNDFDQLADKEDPGCSKSPPPLPSLPPYKIVPLEDGYGLIKGNINSRGIRYYFLPTDRYYDKTIIDVSKGERWFPSIYEAKEAGWIRPYKSD